MYVFACTAPAPPGGSDSNVNSKDSAKKKTSAATEPTAAASASASPSAAEAAGTAATCGAKGTFQECSDCCVGTVKKNAGADKFQACLCESATKSCSPADAKLFCTPPDNNQPYGGAPPACSPDYEGCSAEADKACAADALCAAVQKCWTESQCEQKAGFDAGL
jgi:hypothetical protein